MNTLTAIIAAILLSPVPAIAAAHDFDARLAMIFHNPFLPKIVLGDTGTPDIHGTSPIPPYDPDLDYSRCAPITLAHPICIPGNPPDDQPGHPY